MEERYEKDGIVYFKKPYKVKRSDWIGKHLDCDSIVDRDSINDKYILVICYASSEEFNIELKRLRDKKYPNHLLLVGISSDEINCI